MRCTPYIRYTHIPHIRYTVYALYTMYSYTLYTIHSYSCVVCGVGCGARASCARGKANGSNPCRTQRVSKRPRRVSNTARSVSNTALRVSNTPPQVSVADKMNRFRRQQEGVVSLDIWDLDLELEELVHFAGPPCVPQHRPACDSVFSFYLFIYLSIFSGAI